MADMSTSISDDVPALKLDEQDQNTYGQVLSHLRIEEIASFASGVRRSGHPSTKITDEQHDFVGCRLLTEIKGGSYHAVLTLAFTDGVQWILRIPAQGYAPHWTEATAKALVSEAQTMRLIRRKTTIPVPEVYAFDSTDNELGCPFILMEKLEGKHINNGWFSDEMSPSKREQFRARCLQGIAAAMAQLDKLSFDQGGSLVFDGDGSVSGIGPRYYADFDAFHQKLLAKDLNEDDAFPFHETGPLSDIRSYFLAALDQREGLLGRTPFSQGAHILLRHLIDWSLMDSVPSQAENKAFVLAHPDFDTQNILTDEDGALTGIIDWDWVAAVPRSVGSLKFPNFLTRDFNPDSYNYDIRAGRPEDGCDECSPAELKCYRAIYSQFMEIFLGGRDEANVTRRSLVMHSLDVAASNPHMTLSMVCHLFEEIEGLTAAQAEIDVSDTTSEPSAEAGEDEDDINEMSLDECLREIEKLTAPLTVDSSLPPIARKRASEGPPAKHDSGIFFTAGCQRDKAPLKAKESYGRKLGRAACRWSSRKFRAAADRLHRDKAKIDQCHQYAPDLEICEIPESHKVKLPQALCNWTRLRLKQVIKYLHQKPEFGDNQGLCQPLQARVKKGFEAIIDWLQEKLGQLIELIHPKQHKKPHGIEEDIISEATANQSSSHQVKESDQICNKAACGQIARMLRNDNWLTEVAQQAIARWVVRNLRSENEERKDEGEELSEDGYATQRLQEYEHYQQRLEEYCQKQAFKKATKAYTAGHDSGSELPSNEDNGNNSLGDPYFNIISPNHNRWQDPSTEGIPGYQVSVGEDPHSMEDHRPMDVENIDERDAISADTNGSAVEVDVKSDSSEESEARMNDEDDSDMMTDATSVPHLTPTLDLGDVMGAIDDVDYDIEIREEDTLSKDTEDSEAVIREEPVDNGHFSMWGVCIALSKGNLDERRMKRLRDGYLALLSQSL